MGRTALNKLLHSPTLCNFGCRGWARAKQKRSPSEGALGIPPMYNTVHQPSLFQPESPLTGHSASERAFAV